MGLLGRRAGSPPALCESFHGARACWEETGLDCRPGSGSVSLCHRILVQNSEEARHSPCELDFPASCCSEELKAMVQGHFTDVEVAWLAGGGMRRGLWQQGWGLAWMISSRLLACSRQTRHVLANSVPESSVSFLSCYVLIAMAITSLEPRNESPK